MGTYLSIKDDRGKTICTGKGGVGYAFLMFLDVFSDEDKVVLRASGADALDTLKRNMHYLEQHRTEENASEVDKIYSTLKEIKGRIRPSGTYECDVSEYFIGMKLNPKYDRHNLIQEWYDRMQDAIHGFNTLSFRVPHDATEECFCYELKQALDIQYGIYAVENNEANIIYRIDIKLSEGEKEIVDGKYRLSNSNDDNSYTSNYARRKIYYAVQSHLGFAPSSILLIENTSFYVVFSKQKIQEWWSDSPYLHCSYQLSSTYPIDFMVKNTPTELEKFYCYAAWKSNIASIQIGNKELLNLPDWEISNIIGKNLWHQAYEMEDIVMVCI